jgi:hypothetical protein
MGTLALFWLGGLIPLALFGTEMGVLFAAGQPNRRRAALTGLAAVAATLAAAFVLPVNQMIAAGTFQLALNMAAIDDPRVRAVLPDFPDMHSMNVWLRIGGVVLAMAAVWLFTVGRLRRGSAERNREVLR